MSKSASCFPSLSCMRKTKNNSSIKMRSTARMPTMREFINSHNNAGTQTSMCEGEPHRMGESTTLGSKAGTPLSYKSTIAIRQNTSFIPLSSMDSSKIENCHKPQSPNLSVLSRRSFGTSKNNTVFMSKGSFDAIFSKFTLSENHEEKKSDIFENRSKQAKDFEMVWESREKEKEEEKISFKVDNPFVLANQRMPRIIPITPGPRKRSLNSRPAIRPNFKPILPNIQDMEYFFNSPKPLFEKSEDLVQN